MPGSINPLYSFLKSEMTTGYPSFSELQHAHFVRTDGDEIDMFVYNPPIEDRSEIFIQDELYRFAAQSIHVFFHDVKMGYYYAAYLQNSDGETVRLCVHLQQGHVVPNEPVSVLDVYDGHVEQLNPIEEQYLIQQAMAATSAFINKLEAIWEYKKYGLEQQLYHDLKKAHSFVGLPQKTLALFQQHIQQAFIRAEYFRDILGGDDLFYNALLMYKRYIHIRSLPLTYPRSTSKELKQDIENVLSFDLSNPNLTDQFLVQYQKKFQEVLQRLISHPHDPHLSIHHLWPMIQLANKTRAMCVEILEDLIINDEEPFELLNLTPLKNNTSFVSQQIIAVLIRNKNPSALAWVLSETGWSLDTFLIPNGEKLLLPLAYAYEQDSFECFQVLLEHGGSGCSPLAIPPNERLPLLCVFIASIGSEENYFKACCERYPESGLYLQHIMQNVSLDGFEACLISKTYKFLKHQQASDLLVLIKLFSRLEATESNQVERHKLEQLTTYLWQVLLTLRNHGALPMYEPSSLVRTVEKNFAHEEENKRYYVKKWSNFFVNNQQNPRRTCSTNSLKNSNFTYQKLMTDIEIMRGLSGQGIVS